MEASVKTHRVFACSLLHILTFATLTLATLTLVHAKERHPHCVKAATFNAALMHHIKDFELRAKRTAGAILNEDPDFFCLQEVWLESDVEMLVRKVKSKYPHHYSAIHYAPDVRQKPTEKMSWDEWLFRGPVDSPCSFRDISYFTTVIAGCALARGCGTNLGPELAACISQKCSYLLRQEWFLSPKCIQCVILMGASIGDITESCGPDVWERSNRLNSPGLLLISKAPITSAKYVSFHPDKNMAAERGYLQAEVKGYSVVCTHLSANLEPYVEYDAPAFTSYMEQQTHEIQILLQNRYSHILMGDINTGPIIAHPVPEKNLSGEVPENFRLFQKWNIKFPYLSLDGRCTYCQHNALVGNHNDAIDNIILVGEDLYARSAKRIFDDSPSDPVSDHFGVQVSVCTKAPVKSFPFVLLTH